jgi:hypothetical protein
MKKFATIAALGLALAACGGSSDDTAAVEGNMLGSGEGFAKTTYQMPPVTGEGYLKLKPGLWTRTVAGQSGEDRICVDESVYKQMQPQRDLEKVLTGCGSVEQNISQQGIKFTASCGGQAVEGVLSGTDQALRTEINAGGTQHVVETKWTGECPAGMAPGATQ